MIYRLLRNCLFLMDAEAAHYFSMNLLKQVCRVGAFRKIIHAFFGASHPVNCMGLHFNNAVGLGAGFDKNAKYLSELETLGFGFVEIGTVTPLPQEGNEKPRLFRLTKDKALINRMGFNNEGAETIGRRLSAWRAKHRTSQLIIGGNIGKNKATPNELAWQDYLICFRELHPYVDYFVVNVSSPNTPGLRALQEKDSLKTIFHHLHQENLQQTKQKPILLKIAPDLTDEQIGDIIELSQEISLDGLIVSNTTIDRTGLTTTSEQLTDIGAGGLSGLPVREKSDRVLQHIFEKTGGKLLLIGSGGIFNGTDAREKLQRGATLVQVWTGFVYEGPGIVKKIVHALK